MRCLGFSFYKGNFRYAIVDGTREKPIFELKQKMDFAVDISPDDLCDWYEKNFQLLLDEHKPGKVAYRRSWKIIREEDSIFWLYPCAVLSLVCKRLHIDVEGIGPQALTAKRLGLTLPKGIKPIDRCDELFGVHPPHWDSAAKNTVLTAWACL